MYYQKYKKINASTRKLRNVSSNYTGTELIVFHSASNIIPVKAKIMPKNCFNEIDSPKNKNARNSYQRV